MSKKTAYVVAGENAGSKLRKAAELGIIQGAVAGKFRKRRYMGRTYGNLK
ncbi:MAG: hypothetical protein HFH91_16675 [Lachnospiraceae bacterium]|nr:hypothetical protein [Lachnospiraceae bacterium]